MLIPVLIPGDPILVPISEDPEDPEVLIPGPITWEPILEPTTGEPILVPTTPVPIEFVQHCDDLSASFPAVITGGNAVVVIVAGTSDGNPVTVHQPTLNPLAPITPAGTFAVWNDGDSSCLMSPPGTINAGGYFISIWVLPSCPDQSNGLSVSVDSSLGYGWDAIEVSGLGGTPVVITQAWGSGGDDIAYDSGPIGTVNVNALIVGDSDCGGGIASRPGEPWTTYGTTTRGAGWQIQTEAGPVYQWNGTLTVAEAWVSGIAEIIRGEGS